ncbi:MAG: YbhB/YbcL family Raf kinase inhibitor-like protein [Aliidongia sp.]
MTARIDRRAPPKAGPVARLIGRALRGIHAGDRHLAWHHPALATAPVTLGLASPWFAEGAPIPLEAAGPGVGDNISPPLRWLPAPKGTAELALLMEDPDAPLRRPFIHLIGFGLAPDLTALPEGALAPGATPAFAFGRGTFGHAGYSGPRAIPAHGPHRYIFQVLALNRRTAFDTPPKIGAFLEAIEDSVLATGRLTGLFARS